MLGRSPLGVSRPWRWSELSGPRSFLCYLSSILILFVSCSFRQQSDVLPKLVAQLFPTLVEIASHLLSTFATNPTSQEIPTMLHLILKTYKTSIILHLSTHQQQPSSLVPWGRLLFSVVNLSIPSEAIPNYEDEEERERSEWWKAKKWAYGILGRLFHRFGNPSQLPSSMQKEYKGFATHFVDTFAPEIFKIYMEQVEAFVDGRNWLSKKCQYRIFTFFTEWYAFLLPSMCGMVAFG